MTLDTWHRGDWMQTFTGRAFYPRDPREEDIDIRDIAHSLAMQCRYNGHVQRFYSVAEHCVHLSRAVAPELALWALLHDATEAYVGDMVRPLKVSMPDFVLVEDRIMAVIARKFGLTGGTWFVDEGTVTMPAAVKAADTAILLNERAALLTEPPRPWSTDTAPLPIEIQAWAPAEAERQYLQRFAELTSHTTPSGQVHNHGAEDGPGLGCREIRLADGTLRGACIESDPIAVNPLTGHIEGCEYDDQAWRERGDEPWHAQMPGVWSCAPGCPEGQR